MSSSSSRGGTGNEGSLRSSSFGRKLGRAVDLELRRLASNEVGGEVEVTFDVVGMGEVAARCESIGGAGGGVSRRGDFEGFRLGSLSVRAEEG